MESTLIPKIISEIKDKVEGKDRKHLSEEAYLAKTIKFFDVFNVGAVSYENFQQGLEKLGIYYPASTVIPFLKHFDEDNRGSIDYNEFAKKIYRPVTEKPKVSQVSESLAEELKEDPMNLFNYLKERLVNRGAGSIIGLKRVFQIIDKDSVGTISLDNFILVIKDIKIDLTTDQIILLFTLFDQSNRGYINYIEFFRALQGQMTIKRFELVSKTFDHLDKEGTGYVNINDLIDQYDASKHPYVISGKSNSKDMHDSFVNAFSENHLLESTDSGDLNVSKNEFIDYYTTVSATVGMDTDFELIMNNCWNILAETPTSHYERGWTNLKGEGRTMEEEQIYRKMFPDSKPTLSSGLESRHNPWQTVNTYYQNK